MLGLTLLLMIILLFHTCLAIVICSILTATADIFFPSFNKNSKTTWLHCCYSFYFNEILIESSLQPDMCKKKFYPKS